MSRDRMPIYPADMLADAAGMSTEAFGAYFLLLMFYWWHKHLPSDERQLANIARCYDIRHWRRISGEVSKKFSDGWRHERMEIELKRKRPGGYFGAPPAYTLRPGGPEWVAVRMRIFSRDNFTCTYCGADQVELECDHITPVSRGGKHDDNNLTTACKPCNRSKAAKLVSEWMQ